MKMSTVCPIDCSCEQTFCYFSQNFRKGKGVVRCPRIDRVLKDLSGTYLTFLSRSIMLLNIRLIVFFSQCQPLNLDLFLSINERCKSTIKTNNSIKIQAKDLHKHFSKEDTGVAHKLMKRCKTIPLHTFQDGYDKNQPIDNNEYC